jgi:hypothetical protein
MPGGWKARRLEGTKARRLEGCEAGRLISLNIFD